MLSPLLSGVSHTPIAWRVKGVLGDNQALKSILAAGHAESLNARGETVRLYLSERVPPKQEYSVPNGSQSVERIPSIYAWEWSVLTFSRIASERIMVGA